MDAPVIDQDKEKEIRFFDRFAEGSEHYDVLTAASTARLLKHCVEQSRLRPGSRVVDLGCGSGTFTDGLRRMGFEAEGVDLSSGLIRVARERFPEIEFRVADVESLPFAEGTFDGVLLSGILHHLPDPGPCIREVRRVLKPNGVFLAFDPNRRNPFMWLYRDRSSPLYSPKGVTENERPVIAEDLRAAFEQAGFEARSSYLSGLRYRYVESAAARLALPIYNLADTLLFIPPFMSRYRAFVVTVGTKT